MFSLAFSPCPNDTFIFDALVNKKIDTKGLDFEIHLEDVQTLNEWALQGKMDFTKISYGVLPLIHNEYKVLNSGSALGKGVGPLLITRNIENELYIESLPIVIPGKNTTAHLLFSFAYPKAIHKTFMVFNQIEDYVLNHENCLGVIIHENRFTYQNKGLQKVLDLGEHWEKTINAPIPLGGIVANNRIDKNITNIVDDLIYKSLDYAFKNYPTITNYVKQHAQEMEEQVMKQHIDLYVNNYTLNLGNEGKKAIKTLLKIYNELHHQKINFESVFVNE